MAVLETGILSMAFTAVGWIGNTFVTRVKEKRRHNSQVELLQHEDARFMCKELGDCRLLYRVNGMTPPGQGDMTLRGTNGKN